MQFYIIDRDDHDSAQINSYGFETVEEVRRALDPDHPDAVDCVQPIVAERHLDDTWSFTDGDEWLDENP